MRALLLPNARLSLRWVVLTVGILLWLWICAAQLVHQANNPGKLGMGLLAVLILAPILLLYVARLPIYLLVVYAALVPFDRLLVSGAGPSYLRFLGFLTGMSLLLSMVAVQRVAKPSRSLLCALLFAAYVGTTIFWAIDPAIAIKAYSTYLSEILLYSVVALYPITLRDVKLIIAGVIIGAIAAAAYGDYLFWNGQSVGGDRLVIASTQGGWHAIDPNEFAASLILPISLAAIAFFRLRLGAKKLLWMTVLIVLLSALAVSGSRGAAIGLVATVLFMLFKSSYTKQLLMLCAPALILILASPIGQRFSQSDVSTGDQRFEVWKVGIASLRQYWLTGAGVGNFNQAFMQYFLTVPHQVLDWDRIAHSILIQAAVEFGVFGFILAMALWYLQFRQLNHAEASGEAADFCTALQAAVIGLFVTGISLQIMESKYTWLTFSLVAVMRSALLTRRSNQPLAAAPAANSVRSALSGT
jgi:hypothetical protein